MVCVSAKTFTNVLNLIVTTCVMNQWLWKLKWDMLFMGLMFKWPLWCKASPLSKKHVSWNCQGDQMFFPFLDNLSFWLGSQHVYHIARSSFQIFVCCGKLCGMRGCCMSYFWIQCKNNILSSNECFYVLNHIVQALATLVDGSISSNDFTIKNKKSLVLAQLLKSLMCIFCWGIIFVHEVIYSSNCMCQPLVLVAQSWYSILKTLVFLSNKS
jgi:hypothetical protein